MVRHPKARERRQLTLGLLIARSPPSGCSSHANRRCHKPLRTPARGRRERRSAATQDPPWTAAFLAHASSTRAEHHRSRAPTRLQWLASKVSLTAHRRARQKEGGEGS